jgi:tetratricopeptide (TPR) repeat protein
VKSLCWRLAVALSFCSLPTLANAAWHEASSKHFIIYSDQSPKDLQRFALKLEQFDLVVRVLRKMDNPAIAPSARPTIFVVRDQAEVQKLADARGSNLAGFYIAKSSGSLAVVPEDVDGSGSFTTDVVFFHEYAHHLMAEQVTQPVPKWFSEGFAEFYSTAQFERDGSVLIGVSPAHRSYGIFALEGISYGELLSASYAAKMTAGQEESLYGRGWLLAHYLSFAPERQGQLDTYLAKLGKGDSSQAAAAAFGDMKQFERDVRRYIGKSKLPAQRVKLDPNLVGEIRIRPLTAGEAAIMPTRIRSKVGVSDKSAPATVQQAKQVAQQFPNDAMVAVSLAEASLDARDIDGAIAAATRATQLAPGSVEAKLMHGRALLARANKGPNRAADVKAARAEFLAANKLEPEHPEPLRAFYESYFAAREMPTKNAVDALHYSAALAPADRNLRWLSAQQHLIDGEGAKAREHLAMLAFDPHGGAIGEYARKVIALIDAGKVDEALTQLQHGEGETVSVSPAN